MYEQAGLDALRGVFECLEPFHLLLSNFKLTFSSADLQQFNMPTGALGLNGTTYLRIS